MKIAEMNTQIIKDIGKTSLGLVVLIGVTAISIVTNGKINLKK